MNIRGMRNLKQNNTYSKLKINAAIVAPKFEGTTFLEIKKIDRFASIIDGQKTNNFLICFDRNQVHQEIQISYQQALSIKANQFVPIQNLKSRLTIL